MGVGAGSGEALGGACPRRRPDRAAGDLVATGALAEGASGAGAMQREAAPSEEFTCLETCAHQGGPGSRSGPRNWPQPRSEAGGLLCRLPHHFLRSSPDRSKC